jgi:hypothetical protein
VIRLRFVEEYRGRRIVTNGKLYGIQGELITDCRYLDVLGAKAAINSEAGIEERQKYNAWHEQQLLKHLNANGGKRLHCDCGWHGRSKQLPTNEAGGTVLRCPKCKRRSLYILASEEREWPAQHAAARTTMSARSGRARRRP